VIRCEPGVRLGTIEPEARKRGWELRCMPSTWVKSSLAGFLCGGSGGIGSITWGGLAAPGTIKSVTMLTCEASPRVVRFEEAEALKSLHTYGTTGVMIEIEMRLAPKVEYEQVIFSHPSFNTLATWTDRVARTDAWRKRLVSLAEWPLPSYFKPLLKHLRSDESTSLILIDKADAASLLADATASGITVAWRAVMAEPPKPPLISDYSYNHTTLWAIKSDPSFTYFQCGFGANYLEQCELLRRRFPGEVFFHFEWSTGRTKIDPVTGRAVGESVGVGGIPVVKFTTEERFWEILAYCREIGMFIVNTHTVKMEESGRYASMAEKYQFKAETDPDGLLNPGKMSGYPVNPFTSAPSAVVTAP
jgi:FAD/FMN-containing dehydrogenase